MLSGAGTITPPPPSIPDVFLLDADVDVFDICSAGIATLLFPFFSLLPPYPLILDVGLIEPIESRISGSMTILFEVVDVDVEEEEEEGTGQP